MRIMERLNEKNQEQLFTPRITISSLNSLFSEPTVYSIYLIIVLKLYRNDHFTFFFAFDLSLTPSQTSDT